MSENFFSIFPSALRMRTKQKNDFLYSSAGWACVEKKFELKTIFVRLGLNMWLASYSCFSQSSLLLL